MIILILGAAGIIATGVAAHLRNDERHQEHVMLARMAREHGRRKPNRAYRWLK